MRFLRGRAGTPAADRAATDALVERAVRTGEPALRVWTPHRQVAFGRRDARADGFEVARDAAQRRGFPTAERAVGGRAVAFTGSTVAVVRADPGADRTIQSRYADAIGRLRRALAAVGVDAERGEPEASFCPGSHSLQAGGKIAGLGQRVRQDVALTAGVVIVRDSEAIASVLAPVYEALGVPFDPESVSSVAAAGGDPDPVEVCAAIADAFGATGGVRVRET